MMLIPPEDPLAENSLVVLQTCCVTNHLCSDVLYYTVANIHYTPSYSAIQYLLLDLKVRIVHLCPRLQPPPEHEASHLVGWRAHTPAHSVTLCFDLCRLQR